jgi:hypothetical protein
MKFTFEELEAYSLCMDFAEHIETSLETSSNQSASVPADLLLKTAFSITRHIAIGFGERPSDRRFYSQARAEALACVPLIERLVNKRYLENKEAQLLRRRLVHITKLLTDLSHGREPR